MGEKYCACFSLPLNCILLLFSGSRIFICEKKEGFKSFFNRNTCGQQEKNQWLGQRWALFLSRKKTRGNPNFPFRPKGNLNCIKLSHNLKKVNPTLLPCCEKAFYSCISGQICKYFPIPITRWESFLSAMLRDISLAFCISLTFHPVPSS